MCMKVEVGEVDICGLGTAEVNDGANCVDKAPG
jgi:hypothetical protein